MEIDMTRPVQDLMARDLVVLGPYEPVSAVADAFKRHDIHHLPVVDEEGCLEGMVSKSDFLKISHGFTLFHADNKEEYDQALYESLLVKDIMTRNLAVIAPEDSVRKAADIFRENLFHALPVVNGNGKLVGILTTYDLLTYAYR